MKIFRRMQYLFRSRRMDQDLADEMEFHQAMIQKELERSGLTA
jgi:hypothetical protein